MGIYNNNGSITIGALDNIINTIPRIIAVGTSSVGIENYAGVLNYYDGTIISKASINGIVSQITDGYEIQKTIEDGIETTTLIEIQEPVATITSGATTIEYNSLQEAINACSIEAGKVTTTITMLRNVVNYGTVLNGQNIRIDLNGYTIDGKIENNGTLQITDTSVTKAGKIIGVNKVIVNNGIFELVEGKISTKGIGSDYAIYNNTNGNVIIYGGNIIANYGIFNTGSIVVNGGKIESNNYGIYCDNSNNKNITVNGGEIIGNYGIYVFSSGSQIIINGGKISSENTGIVKANGGNVIIGKNDEIVNTTNPEITGNSYGIYTYDNRTTLNYYDGKISGVTAITGEIANKPVGYNTYTTVVDGKQVITLIPSGTDAAVALLNGVYYTKLQLAINAIGTIQSTIQLISDVQLEEDIVIAEGQNITIDLNGNQIKEKIINNGTLTIIDSAGGGKVKNDTGTAIVNNLNGILVLGESSGIISTETPEIVGTSYGIENNGTLNFYDGKVRGETAISGGTINTQSGYTISTTIENNIQTSILVIQ